MKRNGCGGVRVEAGRESLISSAGAALLLQTGQVSGLTAGLSQGLSPWRAGRSVHDPGKMVLDLAVSIALGGDCLADAAVVRAQPELFGAVASDPTISRLVEAWAGMPGPQWPPSGGPAPAHGPGCGDTAARSRRMPR